MKAKGSLPCAGCVVDENPFNAGGPPLSLAYLAALADAKTFGLQDVLDGLCADHRSVFHECIAVRKKGARASAGDPS